MDPVELRSKSESKGLGALCTALILLAAWLPSWGTLGLPFLAEDASILGRMGSAGAFDDWFQAQYGVEHVVRFWRPVVSMSWWLQAKLAGAEAWPGRLFGVLVHGLSALVLARLLLTFGVRRVAALLAALAAALFWHQGGTLTWMAGRTDSMVALGMLLSLWAVLARQSALAFFLTLAACATKEFAFVLPAWAALLLWAQEAPRGQSTKPERWWLGLLPVLSATLLAFGWRTWALGTWDGGYAGGASNLTHQLLPGLWNLLHSLRGFLGACLLLLCLGSLRSSLHWRLALAGLGCALVALVPIVPLAAVHPLEAANERLLGVASLGLAITLGAALGRLPRAGQTTWWPALFASVWLGWSAFEAFSDTRQWSRACELAGSHEARARALVQGLVPSQRPVLVAGFPTSTDGAYCLGLGVSDRFRAPFAPTPRPIWPLRPIYEVGIREREMVRALADGELLLPFEAEPRVPLMDWSSAGASEGIQGQEAWLSFDRRVLAGSSDDSPRIRLRVPELAAAAWLEVLVYTELGYGAVNLAQPLASGEELEWSLRQLISTADQGLNLAQMLIHAADLGRARVAYLELRCVDESERVLAATPWIETRWAADFLGSL